MIMTLAIATSIVLTGLLATAIIARAGLRGGYLLLTTGFLIGLLIGPFEHALLFQSEHVFELIRPLALQFFVVGLSQAMLYGFAVAATITLALHFASKSRRRGDIWNVAVGIGCGLGTSTMALALLDSHAGWPPFVLLTALAHMPFQLCIALLVSGAIVRSRFKTTTNGLSPIAIYAIAILLETIYQTITATTLSIGHWIAWMEPTLMASLWIGLIGLFWVTGLAVMASQRLAAVPVQHDPAQTAMRIPFLMRAGIWKLVALLVIAPAFALFLMTWWWNIDTPLGRVMIYTLLAIPLLAGSIFLRTALAFEDRPLEFRLR